MKRYLKPREPKLYVIAREFDGKLELVYGSLAHKPSASWDLIRELEQMGTGITREDLEGKGWRARRVKLKVKF